MPEIRNRVTFLAPQFLDDHNLVDRSEDTSSFGWIFDAEVRLSELLATGVTGRGFEVGRAVEEFKITSVSRKVTVNGRHFWVIVSYDRHVGDWAVSVNSRLGFLFGFRGKTGSAEVEKLCKAIDEILKKDPGISEIKWQTDAEWRSRNKLTPPG
jgi:hypothetical protein